MLKKTINYVDYNGNERNEDFYFNLSKAELLEMETSVAGGFAGLIQSIINTQDTPSLIKIFKDLILKAYGRKSPDGKRFEKSEELSTEFTQTEAYSNLFMELALNAEAASVFINGVIPEEMKKELDKADTKKLLESIN